MSARYEPTLESVRQHVAPAWYDDAKLGIFVHWTPASVIGFAPREREINELLVERYDDMQVEVPYTEWYENSLRFPHSSVAKYHREHYGARPLQEFAAEFARAVEERWDQNPRSPFAALSYANSFISTADRSPITICEWGRRGRQGSPKHLGAPAQEDPGSRPSGLPMRCPHADCLLRYRSAGGRRHPAPS